MNHRTNKTFKTTLMPRKLTTTWYIGLIKKITKKRRKFKVKKKKIRNKIASMMKVMTSMTDSMTNTKSDILKLIISYCFYNLSLSLTLLQTLYLLLLSSQSWCLSQLSQYISFSTSKLFAQHRNGRQYYSSCLLF